MKPSHKVKCHQFVTQSWRNSES